MSFTKGRPPRPTIVTTGADGKVHTTQIIYPLSPFGLAKRLARRFSGRIVCTSKDCAIFAWNGKKFTAEKWVYEKYCKTVVRLVHCEAVDGEAYKTTTGDEVDVKDIRSFHSACESMSSIGAMITSVRSIHGMTITDEMLDSDKHLLNVENGIVNMKDGTLQKHSPEYRMTKLAGASYISGSECTAWKEHVQWMFKGDKELIQLVQRIVGYMFTGETIEQKLFVMYGVGANGKSVFSEIILKILKDYGQTAEPRTFLSLNSRLLRSDVARMRGVRGVFASEPGDDAKLDMSLCKRITGGDSITVSQYKKDPIEFIPECKVVLLTNNYPDISDRTHGSKRRFMVIPCDSRVTDEDYDKKLSEKLWRERDGILAWCVEGAVQWYKNGLNSCAAVTRATDQFWTSIDEVKIFIKSFIKSTPGKNITKKAMYEAYSSWASDNGFKPIGKKNFGEYLRQKDIIEGRVTGGVCVWCNIAFIPTPPPQQLTLTKDIEQGVTQ